MGEKKLKSKILKLADFAACVRGWRWQTKPDEVKAEKQLRQVSLKYRRFEKAEAVLSGDMVEIEMHSTAAKYNRVTKLSVGLGLFDKDFERELLNKPSGYAGVYAGESGVNYKILSITRQIIPEITDEMAAAEGVGAQTVGQLKNYYLAENMHDGLYSEAFGFVEDFIGRCEYSVDEGDLDEMCDAEMERCRGISKGMGMVFDEMTEEQLQGLVGCKNIADFKVMIRKLFNKTIRGALSYSAISGEPLETTKKVTEFYYNLINRAVDIAAEYLIKKENMA